MPTHEEAGSKGALGKALVHAPRQGLATVATVIDRPGADSLSLALEAWLSEYERPNTRNAYRRDVTAFFDWCAEQGVDPITIPRPLVNAYRDGLLAEGLSRSSVKRKLSACKSFFRYLIEEGVTDRAGPFQYVHKVRAGGEPSTSWLSQDEFLRLSDTAKATNTHGRDFVLVGLLGLCGLRISEVLGARVEHLTENGGLRELILVQRKGGQVGTAVIPPLLAEAIDKYLAGRTSGPIILPVHKTGSLVTGRPAISETAAHRRIKKLASLAGVNPAISAHSFRRTFATLGLAAGIPLHIMQLALGHASPATTMRYNKARELGENAPSLALADGLLGEEKAS